ncbi:AGC family protein kinase [Trichomonas vaginalis G3]|uniref:non-specific serine/threonine protein kinase n=1 Tax=Trichomonas vaginalis (strain ATCC PRA-98 / G3) TaxID=412133 RepID=A2EJ98_TRIV3|nr:STKc PDK1 domain-containing protein [Trichomonas vaginalis G3]EAY07250.1 AGC family protein kinase [Trichomonas vaginalis G3]KAI5528891.1 STKc PDK1 domain-containing protein [Trichomonas vaginalis G3]|eukprot:XP_001319473.1 AGC family protein kinase [Trichomonas vaginalis G3]
MSSPPHSLPPPVVHSDVKPTPTTPGKKRQKRKNDFNIGRVLGRGAFGEVLKVQDIETGKYYAMKVLSKSRIAREKKLSYVLLERDAMTTLKHPNIIRLYLTFQDPSNLYYVVELAENGDLQHVLNQYKSIDLPIAKQLLGQTLLALAHMHQHRIIHRDIKPENILLDHYNRVKITDFGTVKIYKENEPFYSQRGSFVGSPEYVSPETLNETTISAATDLWAFGCLIFQFITGYSPFHTGSNYDTFQKIESGNYVIPDYVPEDAKDIIQKLLKVKPEERLGYGDCDTNYQTIRSHPFFEGLNWDDLPLAALEGFRPYEPAVLAQQKEKENEIQKNVYTDDEIVIKEGNIIFENKQRTLLLIDPPKLIITNLDASEIKKKIPLEATTTIRTEGNQLIIVNGVTTTEYSITCDTDETELWYSVIKEAIESIKK